MNGCCSCSQVKTRNPDGTINQERLESQIAKLRNEYPNSPYLSGWIEDLKTCNCDCHVAGRVCLC